MIALFVNESREKHYTDKILNVGIKCEAKKYIKTFDFCRRILFLHINLNFLWIPSRENNSNTQ